MLLEADVMVCVSAESISYWIYLRVCVLSNLQGVAGICAVSGLDSADFAIVCVMWEAELARNLFLFYPVRLGW